MSDNFTALLTRKIQEGLELHYKGDLSAVTTFIQTHHLPTFRRTTTREPSRCATRQHHDDLEHFEFVLQAPDWEKEIRK